MGNGRDSAPDPGGTAAGGRLGTFAGVFTPSILTILGIIFFLRLGFVTGAAGLGKALVIILAANAISALTSISLSAIATNLRVKGGGDYYLISRTLGVEYGGAIGLVLFLAQSVSIAFYSIGFAEAVVAIAGGDHPRVVQAVAAMAVALLLVLAWLGSDWATRFQYVVMAVLFAAIVAFFAGGFSAWNTDLLFDNIAPTPVPDAGFGGSLPFWTIFALFFPAVTGFTQGVSMSGDLKNPGRSLPVGTFLAIGLSLLIYLGGAIVFAASDPGETLVGDYGAMRRICAVPGLVDAGVIAATLSSALASFLGAPRILQSLAGDRVFPFLGFFAAGHGPSNNPRRGVLLAAGIAFITIALGDLNLIAPVVSMFFLISYGLLNYATFVEARANSPSFRPRFRFFHERLSLIGAAGCLGAMLAIHPVAAVVSVVLLFAVHYYVAGTVAVERWADSGRSMRFQRVRQDLHAISGEPEHPRYWRPVVLAFSDDPERRGRLLRFASWLEGRSGLTTIVRIVEGEGPRARQLLKSAEDDLREEIDGAGLPAFSRAIVTPDVEAAVPVLLQAYGLGPVRANTTLVNWIDPTSAVGSQARLRWYGRRLRLGLRFGCNLLVLNATAEQFAAIQDTRADRRRIDVWHRDNATGRLMLLLAYLMSRHEMWQDARLRLLAPAPKEGNGKQRQHELEQMLADVRIPAELEIVDSLDAREVVRRSADASVVFLPIRLADQGPACAIDGCALEDLLPELGTAVLTLAAQDIELDTEPEAGGPGEVAEAADAKQRAERSLRSAEKEAGVATKKIEGLTKKLEKARAGGDVEEEARLVSAIEEVEQEIEKNRRKMAKARAKSESAAESGDDSG